MGAIIGKPLVFIPVLVAIVVLAVIYVPPLGQPTLRLGAETVTIVDLSASGATSSDGTRDLKIITILGRDGIPAILDPVFGNSATAGDQMEPNERVIGVEHTFGVSGKLIMNALVMYDHQTNTLWSRFLSQVVKSPLVNEDLEIVPAVQTSRQQWVNFHPDTLVLDKGGSYGSDVNNGYYNGGLTGIIGESNKDRRLPKKELLIGMTVSGNAKAYLFSAIY